VYRWITRLPLAGDRVVGSQWFVLAPLIYAIQLSFELVYRVQYAFVHLDRTDFLAFYTGAKLLQRGPDQVYSSLAMFRFQSGVIPDLQKVDLFVNPPLAALALTPLASLPFVPAMAVFLSISGLALVAAGVLFVRLLPLSLPLYKRALLAIAAIGYAGVESIGLGQWGGLQLLALVVGFLAWRKGWSFTAGALLSLVMVKPQLGLFIFPVLILGRHWRATAGFAVGCGVWATSTLLLVGAQGIRGYLSVLELDSHQFSFSDTLPAWTTLIGGRSAAVATSILLTLGGLVLLFKVRHRLQEPGNALAMALALSFVCATLAHRWDTILLALPLIMIMRWNAGVGLVAALALGVSTLIPHTSGILVALAAVTAAWFWLHTDAPAETKGAV
jgi:hypothetical protein